MSEIKESFKGFEIRSPENMLLQKDMWRASPLKYKNIQYEYILHFSQIPLHSSDENKFFTDINYFRVQHLKEDECVFKIFDQKLKDYKEFLEYGKNGEYDKQIEILKYYPEFGDVSTIADRESEFKSIECYYKFVNEKDLKARILANNYESLIESISNTLESIYKKDNCYFDWSGLPNDWGSIKYDYESEEFKTMFYTWFPND